MTRNLSSLTGYAMKQLKISKHKELAYKILQKKNTGALKRGFINSLIQEEQEKFPFVTRNGVNFFLHKLQKEQAEALLDAFGVEETAHTLTQLRGATVTPPLPESFEQNHLEAEQHDTNTNAPSEQIEANNDDNNQPGASKAVGRPKGSTNERRRQKEAKIAAAITDLTKRLAAKKAEAKQRGGICNKHVYECLLRDVKQEYNLPNLKVKKRLITSRIERGNLESSTPGPESPMKPLEPLLIDVCVQKARMGQPVNITEGIEMANSLILNTRYQTQLKA